MTKIKDEKVRKNVIPIINQFQITNPDYYELIVKTYGKNYDTILRGQIQYLKSLKLEIGKYRQKEKIKKAVVQIKK